MKIKQFRKSLKMTQSELASELGVSRSVVAAWENGKCYPKFSKLQKMANVFNCSLDDLVKREDNE